MTGSKASSWPSLRSGVPWLSWPAIPDSRSATLVAILAQLEQSQWISPSNLAALQTQQLSKLLEYAKQQSPFYRQRLADCGVAAEGITLELLRRLPVLSREELQTCGAEINSRVIPKEHGAFAETKSSGSTGRMVTVRRTEACMQYWLALTMREHLWHHRDFSGSLAVIRPLIAENDEARKGVMMPDWGPPASLIFDTGPSYGLNLRTDVARQAAWLSDIDPHYLLTFPTNVEVLLNHFENHGFPLRNLRQIRTIGETLPDPLRRRCLKVLGIEITDTFSSQELGVIAIQCPDSGLYHVMEENLIVEVLDEQGGLCQPGQVGRIVVTDLHNFATLLIRYDTRDYAEVGPPCPCGRGLATFSRIVGRSRNMVKFPDGRRFWPLVGAYRFRDVAPVSQYQLIQLSEAEIEVRLVVERPLLAEEEDRLTGIIQSSLGYPFELRFKYFEHELPRNNNGKFEEFVSMVDA